LKVAKKTKVLSFVFISVDFRHATFIHEKDIGQVLTILTN